MWDTQGVVYAYIPCGGDKGKLVLVHVGSREEMPDTVGTENSELSRTQRSMTMSLPPLPMRRKRLRNPPMVCNKRMPNLVKFQKKLVFGFY